MARTISRRRLLKIGLGSAVGLAAAGVGGVELVTHGVLPGKSLLDEIDGACSVASPPLDHYPPGPSYSASFESKARGRQVGYTIAYPTGNRPGEELPLVVMLHGYGGDHTNALVGLSPADAVALRVSGKRLAPITLVTVDGGNGYWTPHPGDDPMKMVIEELIPLCQRRGLGRPPQRIGTMGISMGGFGALILAEHYPLLVSAVAAISPAIWTSYEQASSANANAYASAESFEQFDAVTHASALTGLAVRVAAGTDDPFLPGDQVLAATLPRGATVYFGNGCHTGSFFTEQEPPSLAFLAARLSA